MKTGRNDPCHCGSGKKFKRCCINKQQQAAVQSEQGDYFGVSVDLMSNWLFAPFEQLENLAIVTPDDLSKSPVMRYLAIIIDEIMANGGACKATAKGNLPAKVAKQAAELLPEFAVAELDKKLLVGEYQGSNEDNFRALHYTRVLAEVANIIELENGRYQMTANAMQTFEQQGVAGFYLLMLKTAVTDYNWSYFDEWQPDFDLRNYWVFMLWRLQNHSGLASLVEEMLVTFPDIVKGFESLNDEEQRFTPEQVFASLVQWHFIEGFLQYWGFVSYDHENVVLQPLLTESIRFTL